MPDEERLRGGQVNVGSVIRVGDEVLRPASANSTYVHALLRHVRAAGFEGAPEPLGIDSDGRERLSFIPGEVPRWPYPPWSLSADALASTATLLRRFHDATIGFSPPANATWSPELADPSGGDVICHNDIRPENIVFRHGTAVAFLDFDFAAPGRRMFDLAHCALLYLPLDHPKDLARAGLDHLDPFERLRVLADAYGLPPDRRELVRIIGQRLAAGATFVRRRVAAGDPTFTALWRQTEYRDRYKRRQRWFVWNRKRFMKAVG